jgi:hypothetical protein
MKPDAGFKQCSVCKKIFIPAAQHMYRTKDGMQCSYSCYRKAGGDGGKYGGQSSRTSKKRTL